MPPAKTKELTEHERAVIDFAKKWWRYPGKRDDAIIEQFGISSTRYFQILNRLLSDPRAEAYDAQTIKRWRRIRDDATKRRGNVPRRRAG